MEFERPKHEMSFLGFPNWKASNRPVQADSVKTNTINGFRRSDLGGQGLLFLCIRVILQVPEISSPEKTTGARAPASLTHLTPARARVAFTCILIRSLALTGVHAADWV